MINITQLLAQEFEKLKAELTEAYHASGMAVTGNWPKTMEVQASGTGVKLMGAGYIQGRKPGIAPPSETIEQWIIAKGIATRLENDITISSLAFIIARKIAREGWQPKHGDIIEQVITPQRMQQIIEAVGYALVPDIVKDITNHLKTLSA